MEITIIILVFLEIILLAVLYLVFINGRKIRREIKKLEGSADGTKADIYTSEGLENLPPPVQRYFRYALKEDQKYISIARLRQSGFIRLAEGQKWKQLKAVQYYNAQRTAYIWVANARSSPFSWLSLTEKSFDGSASLVIRLFSLFSIAKYTGEEMVQSSIIRYVSEAPLFPTSLLPSAYLSWKSLDEGSASAVINNGNMEIRVNFYFSTSGEIIKVTSPGRFRYAGGQYHKEGWTCYYNRYEKINDIKIPTSIEAEWNLKNGDFKYYKVDLEKIEFW